MDMSELKEALLKMEEIRTERAEKLRDAAKIEERCLSVGTSHVFDSIGASHQLSGHSPQEWMVEAVDLRRSAYNDLLTLSEMAYELEEAVELIKDFDTRFIIKNKYLHGWSMSEIADSFQEHSPNYVYELEDNFFRSLGHQG